MKLKSDFSRIYLYFLAIILLVFFSRAPFTETIDLLIFDIVTSLSIRKATPNKHISIIGISEADLKKYKWPIDDKYLCEAIKKINQFEPKAIGLDIYRDIGIGKEKKCLINLISDTSKLVSIYSIVENINAIPQTPKEQKAYNDIILDKDRVVRRDLVHVSSISERDVTLPMRLAEIYLQNNKIHEEIESLEPNKWLNKNTGGYINVDSSGYQSLLSYKSIFNFKQYSLDEILNNKFDPEFIKNKIVIFGSTAESLKDFYEVPLSRKIISDSFYQVPGVIIHAIRTNSLINLLDTKKFEILALNLDKKLIINILNFLMAIIIVERSTKIIRSLIKLVLFIILFSILNISLLFYGLWISTTLPILSILFPGLLGLIQRGIISQRHTKIIRKLLGQTTSPEIAEQLWLSRDSIIKDGKIYGKEQIITALFLDICDFTSASEILSPSELISWLNEILGFCVDKVIINNGIVNKFTGDGLLAIYGAPVSSGKQKDALNAISTAQMIMDELSVLNRILKSKEFPKVRIRIGIHSGLVTTGSLGTSDRLEYAVIGETINCASRLESFDKKRHNGNVRVLVSEETKVAIEKIDFNYLFIGWGEQSIKGLDKKITIYEFKGK